MANKMNKDLEHILKLYKKTTIYVVRCDKKNKFQDSAPCCNCLDTMKKLNIKKIVYSSSDNKIISENPKKMDINHISAGEKMLRKKK